LPSAVLAFELLPHLDAASVARLGGTSSWLATQTVGRGIWRKRFVAAYPKVVENPVNERQVRLCDAEDGQLWKAWFAREVVRRRPSRGAGFDDGRFDGWLISGCRKVVWQQFGAWLVDCPFVAMAVLAFASLIRAAPLVRDLAVVCKRATERRHAAWQQFSMVVLDLLQLPALLCLLVTGYKFPRTVARLRALDLHQYALLVFLSCRFCSLLLDRVSSSCCSGRYSGYRGGPGSRVASYWLVYSDFLHLVVDLPFDVMGLVCCLTVYRGVSIARDLKAKGKSVAASEHR
jgi:hypothetical protein